MTQPTFPVSIVVAMAKNRVIGHGADIPWKVPGEQKHFRQLTEGKVLIMGRKTYDSIGRPLPNRTTIVVSRCEALSIAGCLTATSLESAIALGRTLGPALMVVGGAEIYRQALDHTKTVHLTTLSQEFFGDAFFPELPDSFVRVSALAVDGTIPYVYEVYQRTE